ncbi:recombinase family protein [Oscillospiraceae bacterium 44-34]
MRKMTEIPPTQDYRPIELRHLRVAAYCRVSTELEEQTSSIELQERHYSQLISANPNWESAGIFAERATGLNTKERPEFRRMIAQCRKKRIDLILTKSISGFGRNTLNLCVLGISVEMMEGWSLMNLTLKLFERCSR